MVGAVGIILVGGYGVGRTFAQTGEVVNDCLFQAEDGAVLWNHDSTAGTPSIPRATGWKRDVQTIATELSSGTALVGQVFGSCPNVGAVYTDHRTNQLIVYLILPNSPPPESVLGITVDFDQQPSRFGQPSRSNDVPSGIYLARNAAKDVGSWRYFSVIIPGQGFTEAFFYRIHIYTGSDRGSPFAVTSLMATATPTPTPYPVPASEDNRIVTQTGIVNPTSDNLMIFVVLYNIKRICEGGEAYDGCPFVPLSELYEARIVITSGGIENEVDPKELVGYTAIVENGIRQIQGNGWGVMELIVPPALTATILNDDVEQEMRLEICPKPDTFASSFECTQIKAIAYPQSGESSFVSVVTTMFRTLQTRWGTYTFEGETRPFRLLEGESLNDNGIAYANANIPNATRYTAFGPVQVGADQVPLNTEETIDSDFVLSTEYYNNVFVSLAELTNTSTTLVKSALFALVWGAIVFVMLKKNQGTKGAVATASLLILVGVAVGMGTGFISAVHASTLFIVFVGIPGSIVLVRRIP